MVQVRMLVGMSGVSRSWRKGDTYECSASEAARLIEAGRAEPIAAKAETATKAEPRAKRSGGGKA